MKHALILVPGLAPMLPAGRISSITWPSART
jgi:hypothetical protein